MFKDIEFSTDRLIVGRWEARHEVELLALYGNADVVRWVDDGAPLTADEAAQWMDVTRKNYELRGYGMFAIASRQTGETLGFGGLVHPGQQVDPEVKYAFFPRVWGQGIASEFVQGLLVYAKTRHALAHIIATVAAENGASKRVLEKSGFKWSSAQQEPDGQRVDVYKVTY